MINFCWKKKINKKKFEEIIYEILENKQEKKDKKDEIFIDIDSPLFEIISKINNFGNNYTIYISQRNIDNSKNEYITIFDKLNKSNIKYLSIFYYANNNKIKPLI